MPFAGRRPGNPVLSGWNDYPARIVVSPGSQSGMRLGFEVIDERELASWSPTSRRPGIKVTAGTEDEAAERKVTGFVKFNDPGGNPVELFLRRNPRPRSVPRPWCEVPDRRHGLRARHRSARTPRAPSTSTSTSSASSAQHDALTGRTTWFMAATPATHPGRHPGAGPRAAAALHGRGRDPGRRGRALDRAGKSRSR